MNQSKHSLFSAPSEDNMRQNRLTLSLWVAALALAVGVAGCFDRLPTLDRSQTNLIDKSVFEGEWWYTRTIVDVDADAQWAIGAAGAGRPWPGATSNFDIASQSGVIGRIRWVVDENFLYAYRSTEVIIGSNSDIGDPDFRGSPLAAYRITSHVDVRQEFNPVTGEPTNVISENATDRQWYDRQYVRVDWSQNLVSFGLFGDSLQIDALFGTFRREPVALGITDEGNCSQEPGYENLPCEWAPQFVRIGDDADYRFAAEWPTTESDTVHYMSFVTRDMWTPLQCFGNSCGTSVVLTSREAFLRVPPNHEYAVETLMNSEYDRFGIIRTESRTYLRGGRPREDLGQFCNLDTDCDTSICNEGTHLCEGGLSDELGETDFLTYYRLRHNFYSDSLTDTACIADWQCSERFTALVDNDGDGVPETPVPYDFDGDGRRDAGSVCDIAARRCTIPPAARPTRQVHYTLSAGYPTYLLESGYQLISLWNEAFMRGRREQLGRAPADGSSVRITCQNDDPTQYCFCGDATRGGGVRAAEVGADDTCAFNYDFFQPPSAHLAAGVVDPYDCWIAGRDAAGNDVPITDVADPTTFTEYEPAVWNQLHFAGTECLLVLDVNSCDRDATLPCEQLGDIRYQFMNYIEQPVDFLGVMQPNQDPTTGEAVISPINMAGLGLDNLGTAPLAYWPLLRGESSELLESGEDIRAYFDALGHVRPATGIAPGADPGVEGGGSRPVLPTDLTALFRDDIEPRLERLSALHGAEGRAALYSDRLHNLSGTPLETRLAEAMAAEGFATPTATETLAASALDSPGARPMDIDVGDEATMDRLSPFSPNFLDAMTMDSQREQALLESGTCMMFPREALVYQSQFNQYWATAFTGFSNVTARIRWQQAWHLAVMQHELGHGLGLEHNFAGTFDRDHYLPPAYSIMQAFPLPSSETFDLDRDGALTTAETQAYYDELQRVRDERNRRGLGNYSASTTMDYPGDLSDIFGIGYYDRAAVYFNYFNEVEAFVGDPTLDSPAAPSNDGLLISDATQARTLMTWYRGGESCTINSDCPYSADAAGATVPGQAITQRCVTNPRFTSIPEPCGLGDDHCICSTYDEDFVDYLNDAPGTGYPPADADSDGSPDRFPVRYLFCSNPRLNDISWCNTFDAGESFREAVQNMRVQWEYSYPTSYFRRFRRGFFAGSRAQRYIVDAAKIYQHLLFRLINEPSFDADTSPLGFDDQFQASIDVMNWLAQIAQFPDVGSYELDPVTNNYNRMGEELDMTGADISIEPGTGYYTWSRYQDGALGFFRMERAGVMWDKLFALRALTVRDWGLNFTIDERYFINFYDFFPREMTELFGGYVVDDPTWFAPRVTSIDAEGRPDIEYPNLWSPNCRAGGVLSPCRGEIRDEYTDPAIGGTSNDILRTYAAAYALSEFPVFYDTSWERRLSVFTLDNGDGWTLPDVQADGGQTCGYREILPGTAHLICATAESADYIMYTSERLHTTYVAVKVRTEFENPATEQPQLGFEYLLSLSNDADRVAVLSDGRVLTPAERIELTTLQERIVHNESFLQTLIELQRAFGITSWL
jgi:hypothetical protein